MLTLGSLFDGSGGFPLAARNLGIKPVWASEIEPFPIRVTRKNFPDMKHLGSVLDINGAEIKPVDIITFGSPCQDLSVAGARAGIVDGERSNLFFEAVRIIREMRKATNETFPRIAVWENVPGAFSSNNGSDFRMVLEELARCKDPSVSIPKPKKWEHAGSIVGDGWSIGWRVLDLQYWGCPQRRTRIFLIASFTSESAGEILFKCKGLPRDSAKVFGTGEGTAGDSGQRITKTGRNGIDMGLPSAWQENKLHKGDYPDMETSKICPPLKDYGSGGGQLSMHSDPIGFDCKNVLITGGVTMCLRTKNDSHSTPTVFIPT